MSTLIFLYRHEEIYIHSKQNEKLSSVFQKFSIKVEIKREFLCFLNDGKILTDEMTEADVSLNQNMKKIIIVTDISLKNEPKEVIIKSKEIICPQCKESASISMQDYHIIISNCKNGHTTEYIKLKDFEETQKIDISKIICEKCNERNMGNVSENIFFRCIDCKLNLCPLCKSSHNQNHLVLNYENKIFICEDHGEAFISYCFTCKQNLCFQCGDKHINHDIKYFNQMFKSNNKEKLHEYLVKFRNDIDKLKKDVNNIIDIFNKVIDNYEFLYNIKKNIIDNMDKKFRNFQTLNNQDFIYKNEEELFNIINSKNTENQIINILKSYQKMTKYECSLIIKYKINKNDEKLKVLGEDFVKINKENCRIIVDNQESELSEYIDLSKYNTSNNDFIEIKLTGINNIKKAYCMFYKCTSLISIPNLDKWETNNVTDLYRLFSECTSLESLPDISKWNTDNVTNMGYLFSECPSLKSIPDISNWNTSKVTFMAGMFFGCSSLESLPDISKWNTENVTNIGNMFYGCSSLNSLPDISKWNTHKVVLKDDMFSGCTSKLIIPDKFK